MPSFTKAKNKYIRLMWIICLSGSISYCCYAIISVFIEFFNYGVLINIQVIDNPNIDFPAVCFFFSIIYYINSKLYYNNLKIKVTVCNLNPLDRRYSQSYIDKVLNNNNLGHVSNVNFLFD